MDGVTKIPSSTLEMQQYISLAIGKNKNQIKEICKRNVHKKTINTNCVKIILPNSLSYYYVPAAVVPM